jgi:Mn2+/Fe2+ NRAMP family transporter
MAIDVFLIVFYKFETQDLRKLETTYVTVITAVVAIPAVIFLFIHTPEKGPMYGSVTVSNIIRTPEHHFMTFKKILTLDS